MMIDIPDQRGLSDELRTDAEQQIRSVLARFCQSIAKVTALIHDYDSIAGGTGKECHISVETVSLGTLVVSVSGGSVEAALDGAISCLKRRAAQSLERRLLSPCEQRD